MNGLFASFVHRAGRREVDHNGFATCQVLRALGCEARTVLGPERLAAALDALESCRNPRTEGFGFWPHDARPAWAPQLPDDADDTALMAALLWRWGRLSRARLQKLACKTVVSHRLAATIQPGPPWPRIGAFRTWMRPGRPDQGADLVDCAVNANVLAMLAAADLRKAPGYAVACAMITDAVAWAGDDARRAATLAPFYAAHGELLLAIEAAVADGVTELASLLATMHGAAMWREARADAMGQDAVICTSPYGLVRWTCRAVAWARARARSVGLPHSQGE